MQLDSKFTSDSLKINHNSPSGGLEYYILLPPSTSKKWKTIKIIIIRKPEISRLLEYRSNNTAPTDLSSHGGKRQGGAGHGIRRNDDACDSISVSRWRKRRRSWVVIMVATLTFDAVCGFVHLPNLFSCSVLGWIHYAMRSVDAEGTIPIHGCCSSSPLIWLARYCT